LEVHADFLLRNAADGGVLRQETDVGEVVQYREEGYLCELGDARDEHQSLVLVGCFQNSKDFAVYFRAFFMLWCLPRVLKGRVVFIDENGDLLPCLFVGVCDDGIETAYIFS